MSFSWVIEVFKTSWVKSGQDKFEISRGVSALGSGSRFLSLVSRVGSDHSEPTRSREKYPNRENVWKKKREAGAAVLTSACRWEGGKPQS